MSSKRLWLLAAIVVAIASVTYALSDIVLQPGHIMTELGSDGGKNLYTYLYHIMYGKGLWFQGMNYPFGEHIVYTDGQPLLSVPLSYAKGSMTIPMALSIMWMGIAISFMLGILYNYFILQHFKVPAPLAILCGTLIMLASPQIFRLSGHYALAYACFIPMLFYHLLCYQTSKQLKYPIIIGLLGIGSTFLHPYFAAVHLIFIGCYGLTYFLLQSGTFMTKTKHVLPLLLATVSIFGVFGVFMRITDPLTDRPITPYGILENCAHIKDISSSYLSPLWSKLAEKNIFTTISYGGEGYSYLGIAAILVLIISVLLATTKKLTKWPQNQASNADLLPWTLIAIGAFLFSMGAPFIWHLEWLLDYAAALKQFRTLGRFAWITYYIATILAAVMLYRIYALLLQSNLKVVAYSWLSILLLGWAIEAHAYTKKTRDVAKAGVERYHLFLSHNAVSWPQFLEEHHYTPQQFQASLITRLFVVGSEKLWLGRNDNISGWGVAVGVQIGMQTKLPMLNTMLSRSSWKQAFAQAQTAGGAFTTKPVIAQLPNTKPLLLIVLDVEPPDPNQQYLIAASDYIGHFQNCSVYACYPDRLMAADQKDQLLARQTAQSMPAGTDTCIHNTGPWIAVHFNDSKAAQALFSSGAFPYHPDLKTTIASFNMTPASDSQWYECSSWYYVSNDDYKSPYCNIEVYDSTGNLILSNDAPTKESTDNYGRWLRNGYFIQLPKATRKVVYSLTNLPDKSYIIMDEAMIKPVDAVIVSKDLQGHIMANNHIIKP